ncbi:uncharacterized protein LOC144450066 [Glandiceps talaboti]
MNALRNKLYITFPDYQLSVVDFCCAYTNDLAMERLIVRGFVVWIVMISVISPCTAQDVAASSLTITTPSDPANIEYTTTAGTDITFTVALTQSSGGAAVTDVTLYFSNNGNYEDATTKTEITVTGTKTATATATSITGLSASPQLDAANCDAYTHLCALLTTSVGSTTDNDICIAFGSTSGLAGKKSCPDVAASSLTITDPSDPANIEYTTTAGTDITFTVALTQSSGGAAVTDVKLYFSNNGNYEDATTKTEITVTGTKTATATDTSITGLSASPQLDAANCDAYTHLCALLTTSVGSTTDNDICIAFGSTSGLAGKKSCPANVAALSLTITTPSDPANIEYTTTAGTDITFTVALTQSSGGAAVTDVKLYFSNNGNYEDATTKTEIAVTGTKTATATETSIAALVASPQLDATNCAAYTHLCSVLTTSVGSTTDNDVCIAFGSSAGQAGKKSCPDGGGATSITIGISTLIGAFVITLFNNAV